MEMTSPAQEPRMPIQFGLKTLLAITAVSCLILVPYQWFGVLYLISAGVSTLLIYVCVRSYWQKKSAQTICTAIVGTLLGVMCGIGSITFFFHGVANFFAVLLGIGVGVRPRTMAVMLLTTVLGVYGFAFLSAYNEYLNIEQMRRDYPIVSLADRLEFDPPDRVLHDAEATKELFYSLPVMQTLKDREQVASRYGYRDSMLERLHHDVSLQFTVAAGFGFARMAFVRPGYIDIETPPAISLSQPMELTNQHIDSGTRAVGDKLHNIVVNDFLDSEMMGYVSSHRMAAGFEPHGFRSLESDIEPCGTATREWRLVRLELVSLLRHDSPRVYVSDTLPTMDELEEIPHRDLGDFEVTALAQLRFQKDLVAEEQEDRIVMLGALRANSDCLQCHSGERGRLLGAFSYELIKLNENSKEKAATKDSSSLSVAL